MWRLVGVACVALVGCTSGGETGELPEVELSPRIRPAVAWVGDGAFVFGGTTPERPDPGTYEEVFLADGAVVAPGSARGPAVPQPPFDGRLNHVQAAVVDGDVVLTGVVCAEAADVDGADLDCRPPGRLVVGEYDPDDGSWREIALPEGVGGPGTVWSDLTAAGDGFVVLRASEPRRTLLVLEVDTGEWRLVDEPAATTRGWCIEQGSLVTVASDRRLSLLDLADADAAEVRSAEAPLSIAAGPPEPVVTCTGDGVVVTQVAGNLAAATYDPAADRWGPVSAPDAGASTFVDNSFWTGDEVLLVDGGNADRSALALDPSTGAWRALPPPPVALGDGVWGADAVVVWDGDALVAYDPG